MSEAVDEGVARAHQELAAAGLLAANRFGAQVVSRAYTRRSTQRRPLSCTSARRAPSTAASCPPSVVCSYASAVWTNRRAGSSGRCSSAGARPDYELAEVPAEEAARAVADAQLVVHIIERWLPAGSP